MARFLVSKTGKMGINIGSICTYFTSEDDDKGTYAIVFDTYQDKQVHWMYDDKKKYLKDVEIVSKELRNWLD